MEEIWCTLFLGDRHHGGERQSLAEVVEVVSPSLGGFHSLKGLVLNRCAMSKVGQMMTSMMSLVLAGVAYTMTGSSESPCARNHEEINEKPSHASG